MPQSTVVLPSVCPETSNLTDFFQYLCLVYLTVFTDREEIGMKPGTFYEQFLVDRSVI